MAPLQFIHQIRKVSGHRNVVLPRLKKIIVPLPEPQRRGNFDDAASEEQAHEKIAECVGMTIDVDRKLTLAPHRLSNGRSNDPSRFVMSRCNDRQVTARSESLVDFRAAACCDVS